MRFLESPQADRFLGCAPQTANPHAHDRVLERRDAHHPGNAQRARVRRPRDVLQRQAERTDHGRRHVHRLRLRRLRPEPRLHRPGEEVHLSPRSVAQVLQQVGTGAIVQFLASLGRGWRPRTQAVLDRAFRAAQGNAGRVSAVPQTAARHAACARSAREHDNEPEPQRAAWRRAPSVLRGPCYSNAADGIADHLHH